VHILAALGQMNKDQKVDHTIKRLAKTQIK
jgi:hypothetical protein